MAGRHVRPDADQPDERVERESVDAEARFEAIHLHEDKVLVVLSFGYPVRPRPERSAEEWSAGADRKSLDELVTLGRKPRDADKPS